MLIKRIKNIGQYNQMILIIALLDFKSRYKNSILGYLWSLLLPLSQFAVLLFVFSQLMRFEQKHYSLYLLLGIVIWNHFAESTIQGMQIILSKQHLVQKIYFPKITLIIASLLNTTFTFMLNIGIFFIFLFYSDISVNIYWILLIFEFINLSILIMGISMLLSAYFLKFRDIGHIWSIFTQIGFWLTPVFYLVSMFPANLHWIFTINPMARIISESRNIILYRNPIDFTEILISFSISTIIFIIGYLLFKKNEGNFAEEF